MSPRQRALKSVTGCFPARDAAAVQSEARIWLTCPGALGALRLPCDVMGGTSPSCSPSGILCHRQPEQPPDVVYRQRFALDDMPLPNDSTFSFRPLVAPPRLPPGGKKAIRLLGNHFPTRY